MKMIDKKIMLAGLLAAVALAPAGVEAFSLTKVFAIAECQGKVANFLAGLFRCGATLSQTDDNFLLPHIFEKFKIKESSFAPCMRCPEQHKCVICGFYANVLSVKTLCGLTGQEYAKVLENGAQKLENLLKKELTEKKE